MPFEHKCPHCGGDYVTVEGSDERKLTICSNPECDFNYSNLSRVLTGNHRNHFKLSPKDYVAIQVQSEEYSIGYLARSWGVGKAQIRRILKLNLSRYAEEVFGEKPFNDTQALNNS